MTGSLAPPPPYGSEAGSILLEGGREGVREGQGGHGRTSSAQIRLSRGPPARSPGPQRSPTDISLAQLNLLDYQDYQEGGEADSDAGEGTSETHQLIDPSMPLEASEHPPPDYESPEGEDDDEMTTPRAAEFPRGDESPPIPSYEAATGDGRGRSSTR